MNQIRVSSNIEKREVEEITTVSSINLEDVDPRCIHGAPKFFELVARGADGRETKMRERLGSSYKLLPTSKFSIYFRFYLLNKYIILVNKK